MHNRERKLTELSLHIDSFGRLQAEARQLEERIKRLKDSILQDMTNLKLKSANGDLFSVIRVEKDISRVDWKSVAAKLHPSRQLVQAHTKLSHSEYVQLSTRKAEVA